MSDPEFIVDPTFADDGTQLTAAIDHHGHEVVDSVPLAPPVGYSAGPTFAEFVNRHIRQISLDAQQLGAETFEESDDFDVDDEEDDTPLTIYEAALEAKRQLHLDAVEKKKQEDDAAKLAAASKPVEDKGDKDPAEGVPAGSPSTST